MITESGREAVWHHAQEAGIQDDIRRIAAHFPIEDIAIFTPGKLTWLKTPPRKYTRIRPFESDVKIDVATGNITHKI
ncbi:hypothetical protein L6019_RS23620 [Escherichia coli]|nr:hypothetical protein [Escherichia coli]EKG7113542.1 hypothetical protein [Escherichia coli]EKR4921314.1 hypothetical protein [Escherichia coli]ELM8776637.1 hypothetical protein [Escherichia coli]EMA4402932.1 hypothetical protein [Escherichia coli]